VLRTAVEPPLNFVKSAGDRMNRSRPSLFLAATLFLLTAAACGATSKPTLSVSPALSVEDEPLHVTLNKAPAGKIVMLALRSVDADGTTFVSHASFRVGKGGRVDLNTDAPISGSYSGAFGSGLLTSMQPAGAIPSGGSDYFWGRTPGTFQLTAAVHGTQIAALTFHRRWSTVRWQEQKLTVAHDGVDGTFFYPTHAMHRPAVLAFGGSEGGDNGGLLGARLAADGIPTLYIGYFKAPGLPNRLVHRPLEYFQHALLWLGNQPQVDRHKLSLLSSSYGTQAALLVAADYPTLVRGVAALVPSSVVTCALAFSGIDCKLGSPWSFHGKPVPFTKLLDVPVPWDNPKALLPVEKIRGAVLLACGGRDTTWSSCPYSRTLVARRKAHGLKTTLYAYPKAGHQVGFSGLAYEPGALTTDLWVPWDERAREDLWPHLLAFFRNAS
jgi:dienelactone hydrolase